MLQAEPAFHIIQGKGWVLGTSEITQFYANNIEDYAIYANNDWYGWSTGTASGWVSGAISSAKHVFGGKAESIGRFARSLLGPRQIRFRFADEFTPDQRYDIYRWAFWPVVLGWLGTLGFLLVALVRRLKPKPAADKKPAF